MGGALRLEDDESNLKFSFKVGWENRITMKNVCVFGLSGTSVIITEQQRKFFCRNTNERNDIWHNFQYGFTRQTWTASFAAVLVHSESLSCLWRTLATTPQISSASSNCSPIKAISCSTNQNPVIAASNCKLARKNNKKQHTQYNIKRKMEAKVRYLQFLTTLFRG